MAQLNFDATQVNPDAGTQDAIPAGWYAAIIDQSEIKLTKDTIGRYLELRFNVIDGQYVNRKVFTRLNIVNSNPVAQEIAMGQLSAIAHAVGVLQVADSQQLHNIPLKIKVKLRAASGEYEASNEIGAFKNINENVGPTATAAPAAFPSTPAFAQPQQQAAPAGWAPQAAQAAPAAAAPAAQPWQQPQQPAQMQQQAPAAQQPAFQQAQQPWQQPAQQPAVQQQPVQQVQQPVQQFAQPGAVPPWMQQPAQ